MITSMENIPLKGEIIHKAISGTEKLYQDFYFPFFIKAEQRDIQ